MLRSLKESIDTSTDVGDLLLSIFATLAQYERKLINERAQQAQFGTPSDWWLREGARTGRFPHLRVGRYVRFTEAHVEQIKSLVERPAREIKSYEPAIDVSAFGATKRSVALHRKPRPVYGAAEPKVD